MYKTLLAIISITILFFFSSCSPKAMYQTKWQSTPVVADGDPKEWFIPLRFYDAETKLNYTLSNDDEKIYLCVRIVDELSQAKVMRNGLNIWFDTLAKKNKQCGILFPVPDKGGDEYQADGSSDGASRHGGDGSHHRGGGDIDAVKKKFSRQANQMQLIGFKKGIPDYLAPENEYGINVNINWDVNNIMIYEAVIPFKTFYKPALLAADSLKNIDFSMTIHGFPAPEKKDDGNSGGGGAMGGGMPGGGGMGGGMNGGGMGRGGMGGGMGGGRGGGGGMRGAGSAEVDPKYETKSFWVKVRLSAK